MHSTTSLITTPESRLQGNSIPFEGVLMLMNVVLYSFFYQDECNSVFSYVVYFCFVCSVRYCLMY